MDNVINSIEIKGLWGKYDFRWRPLNPDVNILIGINGSGKTTLFNIIDGMMVADVKRLKGYGVEVKMSVGGREMEFHKKMTQGDLKQEVAGICYQKVSTFDVPMRDRPKAGREYSPLYNELYSVVYVIGGDSPSFSDYRLKATNFPEEANHINERIQMLFATVDRLFAKTAKTIKIDPHTNHLVFMDGEEEIPLYKLSSGEKRLNPNCQIITSTHSPSLFGDGWEDKLVFVEDLIRPQGGWQD